MLAITPDDLPLVGNLRKYPNIFVNVGHGQRVSQQAFETSRIISEIIEKEDSKYQHLSPSRFLV